MPSRTHPTRLSALPSFFFCENLCTAFGADATRIAVKVIATLRACSMVDFYNDNSVTKNTRQRDGDTYTDSGSNERKSWRNRQSEHDRKARARRCVDERPSNPRTLYPQQCVAATTSPSLTHQLSAENPVCDGLRSFAIWTIPHHTKFELPYTRAPSIRPPRSLPCFVSPLRDTSGHILDMRRSYCRVGRSHNVRKPHGRSLRRPVDG